MADTGLIERLVERAVAARLAPLERQLWAQHWLLTELVRPLSRRALLETARRLDQIAATESPEQKAQLRAAYFEWQQYLLQLAGVVEDDTPPALRPGQPVPPRRECKD